LPIPRLSPEAVEALGRYSWPGNVRELKNVMERAPFLCGAGAIEAEHIPVDTVDPENGLFPPEELEATDVFIPATAVGGPGRPPLSSIHRAEPAPVAQGRLAEDPDLARARITQALEQCAGNQTRAAQLLGVSRRTLINHLERLNMPRPKKV
jgi:DNA-binding NtrC family response regulator